MVDEPVCRLVAPHGVDDVNHLGVRLQPPVVFGDLGGRIVGPARDKASFEVLDALRAVGTPVRFRNTARGGCLLGQDRFLLQVANETVGQTRRHYIGEDWS